MCWGSISGTEMVSIVSIQTDQSRHVLSQPFKHRNVLVSIVSIQTDQSRPLSCVLTIKHFSKGFNRINPNRSIPTIGKLPKTIEEMGGFNRINPNRSIPTRHLTNHSTSRAWRVSIVSIQTDQSRLGQWRQLCQNQPISFQSYQSKQINPDFMVCSQTNSRLISRFNRINPNRSIPTIGEQYYENTCRHRFNRINQDRSIPTIQNMAKLPDY